MPLNVHPNIHDVKIYNNELKISKNNDATS